MSPYFTRRRRRKARGGRRELLGKAEVELHAGVDALGDGDAAVAGAGDVDRELLAGADAGRDADAHHPRLFGRSWCWLGVVLDGEARARIMTGGHRDAQFSDVGCADREDRAWAGVRRDGDATLVLSLLLLLPPGVGLVGRRRRRRRRRCSLRRTTRRKCVGRCDGVGRSGESRRASADDQDERVAVAKARVSQGRGVVPQDVALVHQARARRVEVLGVQTGRDLAQFGHRRGRRHVRVGRRISQSAVRPDLQPESLRGGGGRRFLLRNLWWWWFEEAEVGENDVR
mmetsp:Transcript_4945/g.15505  ORF Transcript_4945/g.15505 Transcript_4945/m.15505 type:complete len:286 (-) Transcript_4945:1342-2199(-)